MLSPAVKNRFWPLLFFAVAMGLLEAEVVVYLRRLVFPSGFGFPLILPADKIVLLAELIRELCTLIMLLSIAWLAGTNFIQRFACFLFSFAIWDIFYYAGLKMILAWPESLMCQDVLFLIPITWTGPVLAPLICSLMMIFLACVFLVADASGVSLKNVEWGLIYGGAFVIFLTFIWDYLSLIISHELLGISPYNNMRYQQLISEFVPGHFNWLVFVAGLGMIVLAMLRIVFRVIRVKQDK